MREKIEFDYNASQRVALEFRTGKIVPGRNGDQVMFSLVGGRVMFLDLAVAEQINQLRLGVGEPVTICHVKNGRDIHWRIERDARPGQQADGTFVVPNAPAGVAAPAQASTASQPHHNNAPNGNRPYNAAGIPSPATKIPMNIAVREAVQMVREAMLASGEQWSDASRQGLVSTILIGAQKEGWVTMWDRAAVQAVRNAA